MSKKKIKEITIKNAIMAVGVPFMPANASMTDMLRAIAVNRAQPSQSELQMIKQLFGEDATKEVFGK